MDLHYLKDNIFDFLNETKSISIKDIDTNDKENLFTVLLYNGSIIEIEFRQKQ